MPGTYLEKCVSEDVAGKTRLVKDLTRRGKITVRTEQVNCGDETRRLMGRGKHKTFLKFVNDVATMRGEFLRLDLFCPETWFNLSFGAGELPCTITSCSCFRMCVAHSPPGRVILIFFVV